MGVEVKAAVKSGDWCAEKLALMVVVDDSETTVDKVPGLIAKMGGLFSKECQTATSADITVTNNQGLEVERGRALAADRWSYITDQPVAVAEASGDANSDAKTAARAEVTQTAAVAAKAQQVVQPEEDAVPITYPDGSVFDLTPLPPIANISTTTGNGVEEEVACETEVQSAGAGTEGAVEVVEIDLDSDVVDLDLDLELVDVVTEERFPYLNFFELEKVSQNLACNETSGLPCVKVCLNTSGSSVIDNFVVNGVAMPIDAKRDASLQKDMIGSGLYVKQDGSVGDLAGAPMPLMQEDLPPRKGPAQVFNVAYKPRLPAIPSGPVVIKFEQ